FEGSYEITPFYQSDVNALRRLSPRFVIVLAASSAYVWFVGYAASSEFYLGVLGAMVLLQATVHLRHLRNFYVFSNGPGLVQGRVMYPRAFVLRSSAFELITFSGFYFALFLVTSSVFVLGGALACGVLSINHYRLAQRHAALSKAASQPAV